MVGKSKGFTLVELSIVLVIIGLLISGILVAQSMIGTGKLIASVKKLSELDIAVDNFQAKFNSLPGDSNKFAGDGDGEIETGTCVTPAGFPDTVLCHNGFHAEIGLFWNDLGQNGLRTDGGYYYNNTYNNTTMRNSGPNQNVPTLPIGVKSVVVAFTDQYTAGHVNENLYQILSVDSQFGVFNGANATMTTAEAQAMDAKMDDGLPEGGLVRAAAIGGSGEMGAVNNSSYACGASWSGYNVGTPGVICSLAIRIGGINKTTR